MKPGKHIISILSYEVKIPTQYAEAGDRHWEKTYFRWSNVGPDNKNYVALHKTFGKSDPIKEWIDEKSLDDSYDPEKLKKMYPRERQLFLVYDHNNPGDGLQVLDFSYHNFGKLLDERLENAPSEGEWDDFSEPDENGFLLHVTVVEKSGGGYTFSEARAIDFVPRKDLLPDEIANHDICLDDCLVEYSYDELKRLFLGLDEEAKPKEKERESRDAEPIEDSQKEEDRPKAKVNGKKTERKTVEKTDSPRERPTISRGDDVIYNAKRYSVARIKEGKLILVDDEDMLPGIDPDDCERIDTESEKESLKRKVKKEETKKEKKPTTVPVNEVEENDESWDADWEE